MPAKGAMQSKTLWANTLVAFLVASVEHFTELKIPTDVAVGAVALLNFGLRFITKEPVAIRAE